MSSDTTGRNPDAVLVDILGRARDRGFVGKAPIEAGIEHARGFAAGVTAAPGTLLDLGSGGGLPGLVLAMRWPEAQVTLVEAGARRCDFLRDAVVRLGCADRVTVVGGRAEAVGRRPELRGRYDMVTARGFGRPAVTAECAAPFLAVGGWLVVSEPPAEVDVGDERTAAKRWVADGLAVVGLELGPTWTTPYHYRALVQVRRCPDRYPRRVGIPSKRPLF